MINRYKWRCIFAVMIYMLFSVHAAFKVMYCVHMGVAFHIVIGVCFIVFQLISIWAAINFEVKIENRILKVCILLTALNIIALIYLFTRLSFFIIASLLLFEIFVLVWYCSRLAGNFLLLRIVRTINSGGPKNEH